MIKLAFVLLSIFSISSVFAKSYTLKELIERAQNHPEIQIESFEVAKAQTLFDRIKGETRPKLKLLSGVGPSYTVTGNALASEKSSSINTATYLADIELQIPLFAFNRNKDLEQAATGNLKVKELDVERKRAEITKKLKEYYYGLQYATSLNDFATGTLKDLDKALEDLQKSKGKNKQEDLDKLSIFRSMAQTKKFEIEKGMAQATLGLRFITQDENPTIEQDWIEYEPKTVATIEELKNNLHATNFDLKKANLGLEAKSSFLSSEKKAQLPVFGIFSKYDFRHNSKSTKQQSHFAYDPYNRSDLSVGIGLMWELDFGVKKSAIGLAQAEVNQVIAQKSFAEKNLPLKIEALYLDLEEARKKTEELEKSYRTSRRMLTRIASGIALGLTPAKDIIETYTLRAQIYQEYVQAIYHYELKLAELSYEVGTELDPTLK